MATSGALSTSNQYVKYTIEIVQNSQNIANNTSSVTVKVRFYRTNTGYTTYGTGTVYCKINGTTYSAGVTPSQAITSSGIILFTKTLDIPHNGDGTKTLACSAWISHNAPLSSSEQGYSLTLTTIPRKSEMSAGNGTLGATQTLTVSRKSSAFTHTITYTCGSASGTVCAKSSSTSISWTPPLSLANQNTTSTSVSIALTVTTYNGDTWIGANTYYITCYIPDSVKPTVSISVSDPTGYLTTYGGYVQGKSKLKIAINASGSYGSSISWYSTSADGKGYSAANIETGVIDGSGTLTIHTTIADSRGRTASASVQVTVLPYCAPKVTAFSIARCDAAGNITNTGEYLKVLFSAEISPLNKKNTFSYKVQYKKYSDPSYSGNTVDVPNSMFAISDAVYVFKADTSTTYDVILEITDRFSITKKIGIGSSVEKIISIKGNGKGVAIGKPAELDGYLDVAYDVWLRKGFSYYGTNTIASAEDDTTANWRTYGNSVHFYSSLILTDQPSTYGLLINIAGGAYEVHQIWLTQAGGSIYHRGGNGYGWSGTWRGVLDGDNFTDHAMSRIARDISSLPSDYNSFLWSNNSGGIDPNIDIWSKGIFICAGGQDGALMSVDSNNNLTWGYRANGNWLGTRRLGANKVLWSGGHYMTADQTAYLSESISSQVNGIILTFEAYRDDAAKDYEYHHFFVPKTFVSMKDGIGSNFIMSAPNFTYVSTKYLYIKDTSIVGNHRNTNAGSNQGISFLNHAFVLSYVFGV